MDNIRQEIERIGSAYAESFNKRDAAGIAALYADGGLHINPAGPRTDIQQLYRASSKLASITRTLASMKLGL